MNLLCLDACFSLHHFNKHGGKLPPAYKDGLMVPLEEAKNAGASRSKSVHQCSNFAATSQGKTKASHYRDVNALLVGKSITSLHMLVPCCQCGSWFYVHRSLPP